MNKILSERVATSGMMIIFFLLIIFHLLVLIRIIPFNIVWGGKLKTTKEMMSFESLSLGLNLVMMAVVFIKAGYLQWKISDIVIRIAFWIMFVLFLLNSLGNAFSENNFEKIVFTPATLILSLFSLRLALSKKSN